MCKLTRNSAQCHECGEEIVSKTRWDFVSCRCGAIFVDGGNEYLRRGGRGLDAYTDTSEYERCNSFKCRYAEDVITDDAAI